MEKNIQEAHKLYQKASNHNFPRAVNNLGILYFRNLLPEKTKGQNDKKALECFKLASEQGYLKSYTNLGICYEKGRGVNQDFEKAKRFRIKVNV